MISDDLIKRLFEVRDSSDALEDRLNKISERDKKTDDPLKTTKPKELGGEKFDKLQKMETKVNEQDDEEDLPEEPVDEEPVDEEPEDESPEPKPKKEAAPEITKEYLGNTEDTHYYLISNEDDEGNVTDLQIVDQEGVEKFSARSNAIDPDNVAEFLYKGIMDLQIESIEFGIFSRYLYPYVFEEEEEEDMEAPEDLEEPEGMEEPEGEPVESRKNVNEGDGYDLKKSARLFSEIADRLMTEHGRIVPLSAVMQATDDHIEDWRDHIIGAIEYRGGRIKKEPNIPVESKKKLSEMKITDHENNTFEVQLVDDGTMDTVIDINGVEKRFDSEMASYWRTEEGELTEEGLKQLALDALSSMEEEEYHELVASAAHQDSEEAMPEEEKATEYESKVDEKVDVDSIRSLFKSIAPAFAEHLTHMDVPLSQIAQEGQKVGLELSDKGKEVLSGKEENNPGYESKVNEEEEVHFVDPETDATIHKLPGKDIWTTTQYPEKVTCKKCLQIMKEKGWLDEFKAKVKECVCHIYRLKNEELLEYYKKEEKNNWENHGYNEPHGSDKAEVEAELLKRGIQYESKTNEGHGDLAGSAKEVFEVEFEKDGKRDKTRVMAFDKSDAMKMLNDKPGVKAISARKVTIADESKQKELAKALLNDLLK